MAASTTWPARQWRTAEAMLGEGGSRTEAAELVRLSMATADRLRLLPLAGRLEALEREHRLTAETLVP